MSKPGRNDPCHCGSGKKYKKCCESKDVQMSVMENSNKELEESDEFDDVDIEDDADDDAAWDDAAWTDSPQDDPYPTITTAEVQLVQEWWNIYRAIDDIDEIRSHLDSFLDKHPHLAENLGLEHEVIFELGGDYSRQNRADEYLTFLVDFRKRFPGIYKRSAGFFDFELIAVLITHGRTDEIKLYLSYFLEDPVKLVARLFDLIYLLLATNNTDDLLPLLKQVGERVVDSENVIYGEDIVHPLVIETLAPYIKSDFTEQNIVEFIDELHTALPVPIVEADNMTDIWAMKIKLITNPYSPLPETRTVKKHLQKKVYLEAAMSFLRFLREEIGISWMSAQYYSELVNGYIVEYLEKKSQPMRLFVLSKTQFEKLVVNITIVGFSLDCTKIMALLNGLYFFADYLHACGNFNDEETQNMQNHCKEIFEEIYPSLAEGNIEAGCFRRFPLYRKL